MTDAELIDFATDFRVGILAGKRSVWMCFAVCAPLITLLQMHGVTADLVESDLGPVNHIWIRLSDGRALDPTADQFEDYQYAALGLETMSLPAVYLGPPIPAVHRWPESISEMTIQVRR